MASRAYRRSTDGGQATKRPADHQLTQSRVKPEIAPQGQKFIASTAGVGFVVVPC